MTEKKDYLGLDLMKEISASITIFFCLILIITYIISFLQIKFNILVKQDIKEEITRKERPSHSSFLEKSGLPVKEEEETNNKKTKKIGLGSHYMVLLILSNFFGGITELVYLLFNKDYSINENEEDIECQIFGFLHNFFDLSSVCWTTMLTYLFYKSINLSSEILYKDTKYLLIGFAYWFLSCGILCVIPFFEKVYGFAKTFCAFRNKRENEKEYELIIWMYSFIIMILLNSIFNCFWLYKTTIFYSNKLKLLQNKNLKEYKLVSVYVRVFQIFPIVLIITRIFKFISVIFIIFDFNEIVLKIFIYTNGFLFNINGALNSLACIYFFRGVFWCCFSESKREDENDNDNDNENEKNSQMNVLYETFDVSNDKKNNE